MPKSKPSEVDRLRDEHARETLELQRVIKMLMLWADSEPTLAMLEGYWKQCKGPGVDKRRALQAMRAVVRALRGQR